MAVGSQRKPGLGGKRWRRRLLARLQHAPSLAGTQQLLQDVCYEGLSGHLGTHGLTTKRVGVC